MASAKGYLMETVAVTFAVVSNAYPPAISCLVKKATTTLALPTALYCDDERNGRRSM